MRRNTNEIGVLSSEDSLLPVTPQSNPLLADGKRQAAASSEDSLYPGKKVDRAKLWRSRLLYLFFSFLVMAATGYGLSTLAYRPAHETRRTVRDNVAELIHKERQKRAGEGAVTTGRRTLPVKILERREGGELHPYFELHAFLEMLQDYLSSRLAPYEGATQGGE